MQLQFDPNLDFQKEAIESVVSLFEGQPFGQANFSVKGQQSFFSQGVGNSFTLDDSHLLKNTQKIQEKNNIEKSKSLQSRNFSLEMETGTGKTYVYLRTLFELNQHYGFKKFIVVVPSLAVKEGVIKSLDIMRSHFKDIYKSISFDYYLYNSKRFNTMRNFRDSSHMQIMIINIQAFQRDIPQANTEQKERYVSNIIYQEYDRMGGRPIDFISATHPIVVIDEPQSVDNTEKSRKAIAKLKAPAILRYSATHRNSYNLLYKIGPIEAYNQHLVKRIEIASIHAEEDHSSAYIKYIHGENKTRGESGLRAFLEIHKKTKTGIKAIQVKVKRYDDLYKKSNNHWPYLHGFQVEHIDIRVERGHIKFSNGREVYIRKSIGAHQNEVKKSMIQETIQQHLEKELEVKDSGIKVLSLFFLDSVSDYRIYHSDGTTKLGKIGQWFEECYNAFVQNDKYKNIISFKTEDIHNGYFSKDRKGKVKDTRGNTKDDEDTYSLIMRDKEKLLDPHDPLRFIFSHTALKEGWDNPNVFQICVLRDVASIISRRQQIGRGLRLPVNSKGERIHNPQVNRLTVISSEGYEEYAQALQKEYEEDVGVRFERNQIGNAKKRSPIQFKKKVCLNEEFRRLWEKISQRTRYTVDYDTEHLIKMAIRRIQNRKTIASPKISSTQAQIGFTKTGVVATQTAHDISQTIKPHRLPNIITYLREKTELTRRTLVQILCSAGNLEGFLNNPSHFMESIAYEIISAKRDMMVDNIQYKKVNDEFWEMQRIEKEAEKVMTGYIRNLYELKNTEKSFYDFIEFESEVENRFATDLDNNQHVKFFVKLPHWFKVDTPIGAYNPDWAFVTEREERLYFVQETKSTLDRNQWRLSEGQKLDCGRQHFNEIGTDFAVVTSLNEVKM